MKKIETVEELEQVYDAAVQMSLTKVVRTITPLYREWIEAAKFVVLSTVGPEGTDGSPRGDDGPVLRILDDKTVLMPDWRGNNRMDSLRNIVRDGRVSLMFMVPGNNNVVRINGTAIVTTDEALCSSFIQGGKHPRSVIVITIGEMYFQCAKAIMRSRLWSGETTVVPRAGQFLQEAKSDFDGATYDANYAETSKERMW